MNDAATATENVLPYGGTEKKDEQVRRMFDTIASRYDRLNHLLSLGFDRMWRRKAIDMLRLYNPQEILDVASGTGDLAITMCRRLHPWIITSIDISREMMAVGAAKAKRKGFDNCIRFEYADCMALPYADNTFHAVTVAFGVRNFANIRKGLAEIYRVLCEGGRFILLELSTPQHFPAKQLYSLYSHTVIPLISSLFSLERAAYRYLPASISQMPQGDEMLGLMAEQGFRELRARRFTMGVCTVYSGAK